MSADVGTNMALPPGAAEEGPREERALRLALDVFLENKLALAGAITIVLVVLFCFVGPLVYQTDQVHTNIEEATLPPSWNHPLGTDDVGYDQLGRLMVGGQTSLEVALGAGNAFGGDAVDLVARAGEF